MSRCCRDRRLHYPLNFRQVGDQEGGWSQITGRFHPNMKVFNWELLSIQILPQCAAQDPFSAVGQPSILGGFKEPVKLCINSSNHLNFKSHLKCIFYHLSSNFREIVDFYFSLSEDGLDAVIQLNCF